MTGAELGLNVLHRTVTPEGIGAPVAEVVLGGLLLFMHGGQLILRAEAGVSLALLHQLFGIHMVNGGTPALTVRAVAAVVTVNGGTFVKADVIVAQSVDEHLYGTGHFPFRVRILHPQEQHTAALVAQPLGDGALHQIAQMDKAGGGGSHTGDDCTLREISCGEACLQILRCVGHIGKQKIC